MNFFDGLEKFGFKQTGKMDLFADEKDTKRESAESAEKEEEIPKEEEFILEKSVRCTVCDKVFRAKIVKSGRVKRLEPDLDLRPRYQYIDTLKYDVSSCPYCGYTALNRFFEHLTLGQIKLIREQVCENFRPSMPDMDPSYTYDKAIDMHKLSLFNSVAKKAKTSEKAYTCLIISWLLRGKVELLETESLDKKEEIEACRKEEEAFYQQAYEGLMKAAGSETPPICGMDQSTMDYLLAVMSFHFQKYDVASKILANVITSPSANRKIKDKALELKDDIIKQLRKNK